MVGKSPLAASSTNFTASTGDWHFLQTVVGTDNVAVTKVDGTTADHRRPQCLDRHAVPILNYVDHRLRWRPAHRRLAHHPGVARAFAVPTIEAFPDS